MGDDVLSGTVNQFGAFDMRASKVGEDSSVQRMIRLVQSADAGKAKIVGMADRWATWVVIIALSAAILCYIFTHEIIRSVTILVVFCPCALVLATPTAIMAAIGNVTKHGFLVREGDALERLASVSKITFDKTGTLTFGQPKVVKVKSCNGKISDDELYSFVASAELRSEHPLGKAVVSCYKQNKNEKIIDSSEFAMVPGKGVSAVVNGHSIVAGNKNIVDENTTDKNIADNKTTNKNTVDKNIKYMSKIRKNLKEAGEYEDSGCTIIYIAIDGNYTGFIALADTLRDDAAEMISGVTNIGITPVLLTGDNKNAAVHIASEVGINEIKSGCLPEDKLMFIDEQQNTGNKICMMGDGINDAPALKKAYVGIAMGGVGSDIAVDAADIVLVDDDIKELPHLLNLSRRMMLTIKCNLTFSMTLNFVAIILAISGILNPVVGALVHNAGSVFVIINSALLLRWKKR